MSKDYSAIGKQYAEGVVSDVIPACKWIKLACQRHLDDLEWQDDDTFKYKFDTSKADKACKFLEKLPHTKGKWAAKDEKVVLEPWQCFLVINIFGWIKKSDGFRRFRKAFLIVPRKNGKSFLAAGIGNKMFVADGEFGAEVYSGATTEKQAWEVFRPAKLMVDRTPALKEHFKIQSNAKNLNVPANGSRFEPIIGKPGDGASPSCAIIDEYHEHPTDDLLDTMETGMGAREQPLSLVITTAGDNLAGPCYELQMDVQKMLEGTIDNDQLFGLIYTVDDGDDWTDIEVLKKANPNFGVSVSEEFLIGKQREAMTNARKQSTFKTKHLNIWVGARDAYYNVEKWKACANTELALEQFAGQECFLGIDLASKVDVAALRILFPDEYGGYTSFGKYYLPEETVETGENEHYRGWVADGWITETEGEMIDFEYIENDILDICSMFQVRELAFDPFQATYLVTRLQKSGFEGCVEVRATVANFSDPMKTLDGLMRSGKVHHNGDPVMSWMISNVTGKADKKDNVFPNKPRPEAKIDGVIAELMALARMPVAETPGDLDDFLNNPISIGL